MSLITFTILFFLVVAFFVFFGAFVIVQQGYCALVTRLGSYAKTLPPGFHVIAPFLDVVDRRVDLREQVLPLSSQMVITKDNVNINVDAIVYYQIVNPYAAIYEINNLVFAIEQLALTSLRNIIGALTLDETLVSREHVNIRLQETMDKAATKWGIKTNRVELKDINPPPEIQKAMNIQMEAERNKRAVILEAEGFKEAQILRAEGEKQAAIKRAEGVAQKTRLEVEAQGLTTKVYIENVNAAKASPEALQVMYMDTLQKLAHGAANKIFLPVESLSVAGVLAAGGQLLEQGMKKLTADKVVNN